MDEVEAKAEVLLKEYWSDVVRIFGKEPRENPRYRTLIQAVVVGARPPRNVLEEMEYLRR